MDIRKLAEEGCTEEIEQQLMELDSEFRFKCRKCGKCCKHQDTILFTPRDIFNIAKEFRKSEKCCQAAKLHKETCKWKKSVKRDATLTFTAIKTEEFC